MGKPSSSGPLKDLVNFQAYNDVIDGKDASNTSNDYYMKCYNFWLTIKKLKDSVN